jgi:hypothetical protein
MQTLDKNVVSTNYPCKCWIKCRIVVCRSSMQTLDKNGLIDQLSMQVLDKNVVLSYVVHPCKSWIKWSYRPIFHANAG